jgi:hypothetical protein
VDISTGLAIVAILVAVLSANYAREALSASKKSNDIALHSSQKEIYDAFLALKSHMTQRADLAEMEYVGKFYQSSINSKLYFDEKLSSEIERYFKTCFKIADLNRTKLTKEQRRELMAKAKVAEKFANAIEPQLNEVLTIK